MCVCAFPVKIEFISTTNFHCFYKLFQIISSIQRFHRFEKGRAGAHTTSTSTTTSTFRTVYLMVAQNSTSFLFQFAFSTFHLSQAGCQKEGHQRNYHPRRIRRPESNFLGVATPPPSDVPAVGTPRLKNKSHGAQSDRKHHVISVPFKNDIFELHLTPNMSCQETGIAHDRAQCAILRA